MWLDLCYGLMELFHYGASPALINSAKISGNWMCVWGTLCYTQRCGRIPIAWMCVNLPLWHETDKTAGMGNSFKCIQHGHCLGLEIPDRYMSIKYPNIVVQW